MFEIIDFYEWTKEKKQSKKDEIIGTINVHCISEMIDIKGIMVKKYQGRYYFMIPSFSVIESDTKRIVRVPYVAFSSRDKHDQFIKYLQSDGVNHIELYFKNKQTEVKQ